MRMFEPERKSGERRREDEKFSRQFGNVGIKNGAQLENNPTDQLRIISLLNRVSATNGGTLQSSGPRRAKDPKNGFCDSELHRSILDFQRANSVLAVVDGWMSPNGRTLKLLNAMAEGKGLTAPAGNADQLGQQALDQLQIIVSSGKLLLQPQNLTFIPAEVRGRLSSLLAELERDLDQANKGKPQGTLPTRNAAPLAAGAVAIIVVAAAAAAVFILLVTDPNFRKAATVFTTGVADAVSIRVQEFNRLMGIAQASAFSGVLAGINAMSRAVSDLKGRVSSCGPKFLAFQTISEKLNIAFRTRQPQSLLEALFKQWITAVSGLMSCLQDNKVSPFEILKLLSVLHTPVVTLGITLFDAVSKLFLKGFFPPVNLLKR
jgi:hypothetical protein